MTQFRRYDLEIVQGSTLRFSFVFQDEDGVPIDVTDWQARLQIRQRINDEDVLLALDETDGITVGGEDGMFEVLITDEQTAELDFGPPPAYYDIEIESSNGDVIRVLEGRAALSREVTRAEAS